MARLHLSTVALPNERGTVLGAVPVPAFLLGLLAKIEARPEAHQMRITRADGSLVAALVAVGGRLCWVDYRGSEVGTDLFVPRDPMARAEIRHLVRRALREGRPMCSVLLEAPQLGLSTTRELLLSYLIERLLALAWCGAGEQFFLESPEPLRDDYDRRLTFSTSEVYLAALSTIDRHPRDVLTELFESIASDEVHGVLLARDFDGSYYPTAARPAARQTLTTLHELCLGAEELEGQFPRARNERPKPARRDLDGARWLGFLGGDRQLWFKVERAGVVVRAISTLHALCGDGVP